MNKKLWVGIYGTSFILFVTGAIVLILTSLLRDDGLISPSEKLSVAQVAIVVVASLQFVVISTVYNFAILAKMWGAIQDGQNPITVGKAIGFLFIPVFNIYWIFKAWGSFPTEYSNFVDRQKLGSDVPPVPSTSFTLFPVVLLLTALLVVPFVLLPIVFVFVIARTCDAVNNLTKAHAAASRGAQPFTTKYAIPSRSKALRTAGVAAAVLFLFVSSVAGVIVYRNRNPKPANDELPETVGIFSLKRKDRLEGSTFGNRSTFSAIYEASSNPKRSGLRYTIQVFALEGFAIERMKYYSSFRCANGLPGKTSIVQDSGGNQNGELVFCDDEIRLRNGKKFVQIERLKGYELIGEKLSHATIDEMMEFTKALPFNAGIVFPGMVPPTQTSSSTTTTTAPGPSSNVVALDRPADFSMTAKEFFDETKGPKRGASVAKFKDKVVQISGRYYQSSRTDEKLIFVRAGDSFILVGIDPSASVNIESLKDDDRLTLKCFTYNEIVLGNCFVIDNKGVISANDVPDYTFTANEYFNQVKGNLSVQAQMKNYEKFRGKIIRVSGVVRLIGGKPHYLTVGATDFVWCEPDNDNAGSFAGLDGKEVTLMGVGEGTSTIKHCIVISSE